MSEIKIPSEMTRRGLFPILAASGAMAAFPETVALAAQPATDADLEARLKKNEHDIKRIEEGFPTSPYVTNVTLKALRSDEYRRFLGMSDEDRKTSSYCGVLSFLFEELIQAFGKYVLIDIGATWCLPCRADYPKLVEFAKGNPGIKVLTVILDKDIVGPEVSGGLEIYGYNAMPAYVVIDMKGGAMTKFPLHQLDDAITILKSPSAQAQSRDEDYASSNALFQKYKEKHNTPIEVVQLIMVNKGKSNEFLIESNDDLIRFLDNFACVRFPNYDSDATLRAFLNSSLAPFYEPREISPSGLVEMMKKVYAERKIKRPQSADLYEAFLRVADAYSEQLAASGRDNLNFSVNPVMKVTFQGEKSYHLVYPNTSDFFDLIEKHTGIKVLRGEGVIFPFAISERDRSLLELFEPNFVTNTKDYKFRMFEYDAGNGLIAPIMILQYKGK